MNDDKPSEQLYKCLKDLSDSLTIISAIVERLDKLTEEDYKLLKEQISKAMAALREMWRIVNFMTRS